MKHNSRGERVVFGDPKYGTYTGIANQPHKCMRCGCTIEVGDRFLEDFVMLCLSCGHMLGIHANLGKEAV